MNWIFVAVCLATSLAAASAKLCSTEDDCGDGFCCVGLTTRQMMNRGVCLRLVSREGRKCSEPESKNDYYGGKFIRYCPCVDGMICEPKNPKITDPDKRKKTLQCKKLTGTTTGPDVTDGEIVKTTLPEEVTDDNIVDKTLPPEIVTEETEAPEEEIVETETPEEEIVETEAPEEEIVETEAPEEEIVETEAPEEEIVETEAPEEEIVETEAPEEEVVDENPDVPDEAEQRGPGGERPREDDPDCEDWTYGCHEPEKGPGGERPREDDPDCEDWTYGC